MLEVDSGAVQQLKWESPLFVEYPVAFDPEHSIEAQLPFIKELWPAATILPFVTGNLTRWLGYDRCSCVEAVDNANNPRGGELRHDPLWQTV